MRARTETKWPGLYNPASESGPRDEPEWPRTYDARCPWGELRVTVSVDRAGRYSGVLSWERESVRNVVNQRQLARIVGSWKEVE